jgi:hypothetical protein
MKKLALDDVRPPKLYERVRDEARRRIIAQKKLRRVALGPRVSLVFENRATMIFQVCEMLRAEHIVEPAKIQDEIDVYNTLLPDEGELSATLFVEITEETEIRPALNALVGIDEHVSLDVAGTRIPAIFEAGRSEGDRISAVQYVRFRLPEAARRAIAIPGTKLELRSDLPGYPHTSALSEETRAELATDLE